MGCCNRETSPRDLYIMTLALFCKRSSRTLSQQLLRGRSSSFAGRFLSSRDKIIQRTTLVICGRIFGRYFLDLKLHSNKKSLFLYSLAQQKRPRFPLLTKLISTADQIILKGKVTSFWQQFKAFLLYKLTLLTNSSIPFLPWNS